MPSTPPFAFKSSPSGEVPPLAPVTVAQQPVMSISYPEGCEFPSFAVLELDTLPVMNREPESLPDIPGGGWSYAQFLEYLDVGIAPVDDGTYNKFWSGLGAYQWTVVIDGTPSGANIIGFDGAPGPWRIKIDSNALGGVLDWTVEHTWQLAATYFDRPAYSEFWFDPTSIGVIAFGPGTMTVDPNVPYIVGGVAFGCCSRHSSFFPTGFWGELDRVSEEWVDAHREIGDTSGPRDRHGSYLGLTGPWGSAVPLQYFSSGPGEVPCSGSCQGGSLPDQTGGAGDVYATGLADLYETTTYDRVEYPVESSVQTLAACAPVTSSPVFDVTRSHKAHR